METEADWDYFKSMTKASDSRAILDDLMTAYGEDVWNYAFSITRNREQANDISQEVFIKAFRKLSTFRSESSVKAWLLAITRNAAYDYKRTAFYRRVVLMGFMDSREGASSVRSAEDEAMSREALSDIWQRVLALPVKYREVLILCGHHQLSMKEAADVLGIPEKTVKSRLHQARLLALKGKEGDRHEA